MEKRILLASALSLLILLGYQAVVGKHAPVQQPKTVALPQQEMSNLILSPSAQLQKPNPAIDRIPLESRYLETPKLKVVFSNLGGKITEVWFKDYGAKFFVQADFEQANTAELPFQFVPAGPGEILLSFSDGERKIAKRFKVQGDYFFSVEMDVLATSGSPAEISCFNINSAELDKDPHWQRDKLFAESAISLADKVLRKNISQLTNKTFSEQSAVNWLGFRDKYFCALFKPEGKATGYFLRSGVDKNISAGLTLAPTATLKGTLYFGPQDSTILASAQAGLEQVVNFGFFDPISRFILKLLVFMHSLVPNWGICLIGLSCIIFLVLYPLTLKSMNSMRQMQQLQPKIDALKKQYQSDPQKLNKEIMELYREYKINPFGGCLPLFLQIPIFFALYQALMRSVALKGSSFLWIKDLSEPDRLAIFPSAIPFIGNELNLLPIIMAITMFFQQKLSSKSMPGADPQQQKMMLILMPVLFGVMFYRFPSGLGLYWVMYSLFSLFFQWKKNTAKA